MFGKKQEEKQVTDSIEEQAKQISMIHFLDSNLVNTGLQVSVLYSFVATYRDGHKEILEARADDPLLKAVLNKLVW